MSEAAARWEYGYDPAALAPYTVPLAVYLSTPSDHHPPLDFLATGAVVFLADRVLLVQRASHDSMPNLWETPGGGVDLADLSILDAVARELKEEAGLTARWIGQRVGDGYPFAMRSGRKGWKISFVVNVVEKEYAEVRIDKEEHQNFVWAGEEEVREGRCGEVKLEFTTTEQEQVILDAFKINGKTDTLSSSD